MPAPAKRPTDAQLDQIDELAKHPAITAPMSVEAMTHSISVKPAPPDRRLDSLPAIAHEH